MNHIDTLNAAYEAGWVEAACWAKRDDLMADIESPAYITDREAHLDSIRSALARPEPVVTDQVDFEKAYGGIYAEQRKQLAESLAQPELMVDMTPPATSRDRWMYEQGRLAERDPRSHVAQPEPVSPARALMDVTIENEAAKLLRDYLVQEGDDEPSPIRLLLGDGHSGYGLYLAAAEYPEEGSILLAKVTQPEPVALKWTPVVEWWESGNEDFDKLKVAVLQMLAAAKGGAV